MFVDLNPEAEWWSVILAGVQIIATITLKISVHNPAAFCLPNQIPASFQVFRSTGFDYSIFGGC